MALIVGITQQILKCTISLLCTWHFVFISFIFYSKLIIQFSRTMPSSTYPTGKPKIFTNPLAILAIVLIITAIALVFAGFGSSASSKSTEDKGKKIITLWSVAGALGMIGIVLLLVVVLHKTRA